MSAPLPRVVRMPLLNAPDAAVIRDELAELVVNDLHGPAGGPEEVLFDRPTDWYVLGRLAPNGALPCRRTTPGALPARPWPPRPARHIQWTIHGQIKPPLRHLYGYRLEPSEVGTLVTSYYDWSQIDDSYRGTGIFPVIPEAGLRATLGILARNVEQPPPGARPVSALGL